MKCINGCLKEMVRLVGNRFPSKYDSPTIYICEECGASVAIDWRGVMVWTRDEKSITTNLDFDS